MSLSGPKIGDDPVEIAKRWNGNSGTTEPDFDLNPEDTASLLAAAVIKLDDALTITSNSRETNRRRHEELRDLGRRTRESLSEYVARLDKRQDDHLGGCHDCNYDRECVACCVDGDGGGHNCNCDYRRTDHGYGVFLRRLLDLARSALEAGVK